MVICGSKRRNILLACLAGIDQVGASPRKAFLTKLYSQQVGGKPCMTAIANWKEMEPFITYIL